VSKFVGKYRNEEDYSDDYNFLVKKKKRNEQRELKRLKNKYFDDYDYLENSRLPKKSKQY